MYVCMYVCMYIYVNLKRISYCAVIYKASKLPINSYLSDWWVY